MSVNKPDLNRVWANGAPTGNVVDPDTTTPGKFNTGWQAEIPPFEHFNFIQKTITQGLAHINERGIAEWDEDTVYPVRALAKGSDGKIYECTEEDSGSDPTLKLKWKEFIVDDLAATDSNFLVGGQQARLVGESANSYFKRKVFAPLLTSNTAAQNSAILQSKIDYANNQYSIVSGFGTGSVTVEMPAGVFDFTGVEIKRGVNVFGAGIGQTVLFLTGDNTTGFYNRSRDTNSFADQVSFGNLGKFSIAPKNPATTIGQVMLDLVGFSRYRFEDMFIGWCSGVIGIKMTGATVAGEGGPAQWYNTFINMYVERPSAWPAGGVGWLLGDLAANKEQVTTWTIIGGRTSGSGAGTGINIQSCNTITWQNHTIEGCDVLIGADGAARKPVNVVFMPLYLEGNASNNFRISSVAEDTAIFGQYITGYTFIDNSVTTQRHAKDNFKSYSASSSLSQWLVNIENGDIQRPKFKALGGFPGIDLERSDGVELTIENASQLSSANSFFRVMWNDRLNTLLSVGTTNLTCGDNNTVTLGREDLKFLAIYTDVVRAGNGSAIWTSGLGSPEGQYTASVGSMYTRTDGGAGTTLYVKESGAGNTGWVAK